MPTQKAPKGNIRDYIIAKKERYKYTFTFNGENGLSYYTVHGQRMSEGDFNKLIPVEIKSNVIHLDSRQL